MDTGSHQTRDVSHVHHQIGAHLVGDGPEFGEVQRPGIGAGARQDQLGIAFLCQLQYLVVVDDLGIVLHAVGDDVEILAGDVDGAAVAQMAAVGQTHAQHGVAGLKQGEEDRQVGVGAGVGLDVGKVAAEQLAGPLAGQLLGDVHGVAAAVIPLAGIALGVFIGQAGALRQHHRLADDVLRRDQLDVAAFPGKFLLNGSSYLRVVLGEKIHGLLQHKKGLLLLVYPLKTYCVYCTKADGI